MKLFKHYKPLVISVTAAATIAASMIGLTTSNASAAPLDKVIVVFQDNTGHLNVAGSGSLTNMPLMPGTSPALARLTNGGAEDAFQSSNGTLIISGTAGNINTGIGMMPGTSPSITSLPNGGYEVAVQANTGDLWTYGSASVGSQGRVDLGMMKGTSPAITGLSNGGYEVAVQANTGNLWTYGTVGTGDQHLGMMTGTNPAIIS